MTSITFRTHLPSVRAKAANPSSHVTMAPSRLSSPLSRARSYHCSSTATACEVDRALCQSTSRSRHYDREASPGKCQGRVKTHLASGDAQLEEAPIPMQRDNKWRRSWQGLPLWKCLSQSTPLAITDDGAGQASRSAVGKGDFCPNSLVTKKAR
jgi:hypothetical protein